MAGGPVGIGGSLISFIKCRSTRHRRNKERIHSGIEQWPARKAHNLEAGGSNPSPATGSCFCISSLFIRKEVHYGKKGIW